MLCFYSYVVFSGGNPPPKKLKSSVAPSWWERQKVKSYFKAKNLFLVVICCLIMMRTSEAKIRFLSQEFVLVGFYPWLENLALLELLWLLSLFKHQDWLGTWQASIQFVNKFVAQDNIITTKVCFYLRCQLLWITWVVDRWSSNLHKESGRAMI